MLPPHVAPIHLDTRVQSYVRRIVEAWLPSPVLRITEAIEVARTTDARNDMNMRPRIRVISLHGAVARDGLCSLVVVVMPCGIHVDFVLEHQRLEVEHYH